MSSRRLAFVAGLYASYISLVPAIVNMDNLHLQSYQQGFNGSADLMLSGTSGNTDTSLVSFNTQMQWNTGSAINLLLLGSDYGESNGVRNVNKHFVHGRHIRPWLDNTDYEFFAQVEKNEFTRLSRRSLLGAGLRFNFTSGKNKLILGAGAFRSVEDIESGEGLTDEGIDELTRGNFYILSRHPISKAVQLSQTLYYQPDTSNWSDYRILFEGDIVVKLNETLDMKVSLDVAHDSEPPQTIEETDASLKVGIQFDF
jgi:putative salt-induced outer membrane protein YdiY